MLLDTDKARLHHMVQAIEETLQYTQDRSLGDVADDRPLQHLLVRNIEILGEAASRISLDFRTSHPEIPWRDMIDMRNRVVHAYWDLDLDIIWSTVQQALPPLLPQLRAIAEKEEDT